MGRQMFALLASAGSSDQGDEVFARKIIMSTHFKRTFVFMISLLIIKEDAVDKRTILTFYRQ